MKLLPDRAILSVILLTQIIASLLCSCSYIHEYYVVPCNSRAYARAILSDYLTTRFHSNAPVRLAVIPFSAPANISGFSNERPGLGNELAWKVQSEILRTGQVPIVEVLNRQDWPGKKEEFFTGNYGATALARDAGYDLALVGVVETPTSLDRLSIYTKLIEVESGITVWYGKTEVTTYGPDLQKLRASMYMEDRRPDFLAMPGLIERLAQCVAQDITSEKVES